MIFIFILITKIHNIFFKYILFLLFFFAERYFVAGFIRKLLVYFIPHISYRYPPAYYTYPTHIHSKYIQPIHILPIRIGLTRIPPIRIHSMHIHSKGMYQQESQMYPTNTNPTNMYRFNMYPTSTDPFNAYPFKKFASAGLAMSMSIIAYHFIPLLLGGNDHEYKNLAYPLISLQYY